MSIAQNIQTLSNSKTSIINALIDKGVTNASEHGFTDFANDILNIQNSYSSIDEGKVVNNGALVVQTSANITSNGTVDTTTNNEVIVAVPNTYTIQDEGKVVSNGALVSQTAYPTTITENGTYDTTLNNSVTVESGGSTQICALVMASQPPYSGSYNAFSLISNLTVYHDNIFDILIVVGIRGNHDISVSEGTFVFSLTNISLPKQNYTCSEFYGQKNGGSSGWWGTYGSFTSAVYNNNTLRITINVNSTFLGNVVVFKLRLE